MGVASSSTSSRMPEIICFSRGAKLRVWNLLIKVNTKYNARCRWLPTTSSASSRMGSPLAAIFSTAQAAGRLFWVAMPSEMESMSSQANSPFVPQLGQSSKVAKGVAEPFSHKYASAGKVMPQLRHRLSYNFCNTISSRWFPLRAPAMIAAQRTTSSWLGGFACNSSSRFRMGLFWQTSTLYPDCASSISRQGDNPKGSNIQPPPGRLKFASRVTMPRGRTGRYLSSGMRRGGASPIW